MWRIVKFVFCHQDMATREFQLRRFYRAGLRVRLAPGQSIDGPAIVESTMTTILLRPRERAVTTPLGWLDIALPLE